MQSKLRRAAWCACFGLAPAAGAQTLVRTFLPPSPVFSFDHFGGSVAFVGDVDLDGTGDFAVGSTQDFFNDPGRVSVMSGATGSVIRIVQGVSVGSQFGLFIAAVGDLDGDGAREVLAYAPEDLSGGAAGNELRVFSTGTGATLWSLAVPASVTSMSGLYRVGGGLDATGDGVPDFAVSGSWTATQTTTRLYSGATKTLVYDVAVAPPKLANGPMAFVGDLDGDGRSELACCVDSNSLWEIAIASGATGAVLRTCTLSAATPTSPPGFCSIAALGDIDGDGKGDFAFGASAQLGRVDVFSGGSASLIRTHTGDEMNSYFGVCVAGGVDLDHDGVGDLLVGAPYENTAGPDRGKVFAFSGRTGAPIESAGYTTSDNDHFGAAVTAAGDINGDGFGDYFVGAPAVGVADTGRAYLVASTPLPPHPVGSSQVSSVGCTPVVTNTGSASATSSSPFDIQAALLINQKTGTLFYGVGDAVNAPFHGWFRYAPNPLRRTPQVSTGGSASGVDCTGSLVFDFNAHIASAADPALVIGARVVAQFYSRDPAAPSTTNLTSAVEFVVNP